MLNDESHRAFLDTKDDNVIVLNRKVLIQYGTSCFSRGEYYTTPTGNYVLKNYTNSFNTTFGPHGIVVLFVSHVFYDPNNIGSIYYDIYDNKIKISGLSSIKEKEAITTDYKRNLVPYYDGPTYRAMFMNIRVAACDRYGFILIRDEYNNDNDTYEASTRYCYLAIGHGDF